MVDPQEQLHALVVEFKTRYIALTKEFNARVTALAWLIVGGSVANLDLIKELFQGEDLAPKPELPKKLIPDSTKDIETLLGESKWRWARDRSKCVYTCEGTVPGSPNDYLMKKMGAKKPIVVKLKVLKKSWHRVEA